MTLWDRVNDLFHAARACPLSERDAFLARECHGNDMLRAEVESLLRAHEAGGASVLHTRVATGTRIGDYAVTGFLAAGAMGEVYRARDTKLGREAALKVLPAAFMADADRRARFQREAHLLASLNHPNIATVYGLVETQPAEGSAISAIALELVEGETVADRIARGRISADVALRIARQIAEALEAAHEQGIIHRDLKPANITLTRDGMVKVLDFGLAKLSQPERDLASAATGDRLTTALGVLIGTPAYMSPEQARGESADKRADIWALGCVLYELLAGRRAFDGVSLSDTIANVLKAQPDWNALPKDLPPVIRALIEACLEKEPRARVADAATVRFVLGRPALTHSTQRASTTGRRRNAWQRLVPIGATAVIAGALSLTAWWTITPDARLAVSAFRVPLAEGQRLTNLGRHVIAISRDGSRLVYVANFRLYARRLSDLDATPIPGSELLGLTSPAVSPDGESVVFYAEGSLKRIPMAGGTALTVCAAANPFGVSWDGDTILFAQAGRGILAVPATGGEPEMWVPTTADETADSPQFLPEANAVLFSVTTASGTDRWDQANVVAYSRDRQERKVLIRGASAARYVTSGHIIYAIGGSLLAAPFDVRGLELTGKAFPVLERVMRTGTPGVNSGAANFAVSADGTLIYVPADTQRGSERTLIWVDRQGQEVPVAQAGTRLFGDPRVSPDARRIAVQVGDDGDDIWAFDLVRGTLTRQTFENDEDETPVWSPDGRWIAYAATELREPTIFRRRADGTGPPEALWRAGSIEMHPHVEDWTSDGRALLISHGSRERPSLRQITLLQIDDRTTMPLLRSPFIVAQARVSPDRRWLAYSSTESGRKEVYVQAFPSLDNKWQISTGGGAEPVWSRDGSELFYRGEGFLLAVRISRGSSFSAAPPTKLFQDVYVSYVRPGGDHIAYDVSPDGRRFLMVKDTPVERHAAAQPQIVIVQNWFQELPRLASAN